MIQPKTEKPKTDTELANEFIKKYQGICEEYQFQLVIVPVFVARDDGTFSVKLQSSVGRLPKKE